MEDNPTSFSFEEYQNIPALTPPRGVIPNFAVFNQRAVLYNTLCAILLGIIYIFVLLRLYAKIWIKRSPGFDDVACILATLGLSACYGLGVVMQLHGVGKHQWNVPLSQISFILHYGRYLSIILPPTMLCLKLSLLLLYLRVFALDKVTRYLIYFGMVVSVVAYSVLMFLNIFCDVTTVIVTNKLLGALNFSSDIYILCLPVAATVKLQLSMKTKLGVMLLFLIGLIACALSAVGLVYRLQVHQEEQDGTYLLADTILVTTVEEEVGIMCSCMPFFPAIVRNSPILQKCIHSVHAMGTWILQTSHRGSTASTEWRQTHQKHVSQNSSLEDGLELHHGRGISDAETSPPESPKKTPRMESSTFENEERLRAFRASLEW